MLSSFIVAQNAMLQPRHALLVAGTARIAGHTDMNTMRYVHPSDADMDEALVKAREAQGGHTSGHTRNTPTVGEMKAPAKLQ